jgi:hypothetical protein
VSKNLPAEQPKSESERDQLGRARERLFELSLSAVEYVASILADPARDDKIRLQAVRLVWERTMPAVQRIEAHALLAMMAKFGVQASAPVGFDWAAFQRATSEALEEVERGDNRDARIH